MSFQPAQNYQTSYPGPEVFPVQILILNCGYLMWSVVRGCVAGSHEPILVLGTHCTVNLDTLVSQYQDERLLCINLVPEHHRGKYIVVIKSKSAAMISIFK